MKKIVNGRAPIYAYIEDGDSEERDDRLAEKAKSRIHSYRRGMMHLVGEPASTRKSSKMENYPYGNGRGPNTKTLEAIKEGREMLKKGTSRFSSPDDMFAALEKDNACESKPEPTVITLRGEGGVTITKEDVTTFNDIGIIMHPGEYFKDMFVGDNSIPFTAEETGISEETITSFIDKKISVTPEFAISLQAATGRSAESWLIMQQEYDRGRLKELQNKAV